MLSNYPPDHDVLIDLGEEEEPVFDEVDTSDEYRESLPTYNEQDEEIPLFEKEI